MMPGPEPSLRHPTPRRQDGPPTTQAGRLCVFPWRLGALALDVRRIDGSGLPCTCPRDQHRFGVVALRLAAGGGRPQLAVAGAADDHGLVQARLAGDLLGVAEVLGAQAQGADQHAGGDDGARDDAAGEVGIGPRGEGPGVDVRQRIAELVMAMRGGHRTPGWTWSRSLPGTARRRTTSRAGRTSAAARRPTTHPLPRLATYLWFPDGGPPHSRSTVPQRTVPWPSSASWSSCSACASARPRSSCRIRGAICGPCMRCAAWWPCDRHWMLRRPISRCWGRASAPTWHCA